jgi:hypothetical protein
MATIDRIDGWEIATATGKAQAATTVRRLSRRAAGLTKLSVY